MDEVREDAEVVEVVEVDGGGIDSTVVVVTRVVVTVPDGGPGGVVVVVNVGVVVKVAGNELVEKEVEEEVFEVAVVVVVVVVVDWLCVARFNPAASLELTQLRTIVSARYITDMLVLMVRSFSCYCKSAQVVTGVTKDVA